MTVAMGLRVLNYGDQAPRPDFDSTAEVLAWVDARLDDDLLDLVDLVPARGVVTPRTGMPWRPPALLTPHKWLQFSEVRR